MDPNSLVIKLLDPNKKSKKFFIYEASFQQLLKDIKFLTACENLDEAIESLEEIFSKGNKRSCGDRRNFQQSK